MFRAVFGDGHSFDIFHHHEGPAITGDAAVVEPRNPRMLEACEDLAFGLESFQLSGGLSLQQLDRDALFEVAVRAGGFVHIAHAAAADEPDDVPGAEAHADGGVRPDVIVYGAFGCVGVEKTIGRMSSEQEAFDLGKDDSLLAVAAAQLRNASLLGHIEQFIEQGIDAKSLLLSKLAGGWGAGIHDCARQCTARRFRPAMPSDAGQYAANILLHSAPRTPGSALEFNAKSLPPPRT